MCFISVQMNNKKAMVTNSYLFPIYLSTKEIFEIL